jgi:tRNA1Val (adenine37-N6)-methyltransferase
MRLTEGGLLGGRLRYSQPAEGFRSGIEPVLLAAAIPARPGERVLEGGTGAGAALLCLAHRVPGIIGAGVEIEPALVALAQANFRVNAANGLVALAADVTSLPLAGPFDHAFANPPYHRTGSSPSPDAAREQAKRGGDALLTAWSVALAASLRRRGTLTLVLPSACLGEAVAALAAAGCGAPRLFPLWSHAGRPAKLLLIQGIKGAAGPAQLLYGLALHEADGRFTAAAEQVLRDGAALRFEA